MASSSSSNTSSVNEAERDPFTMSKKIYDAFINRTFKLSYILYNFIKSIFLFIFHPSLILEFMVSSSSSRKLYDAFLSHRGPDTKDTVAFALYDSLEEKGFWTFLDDEKLQLGDSIEPALRDAVYDSSVQIAIFSPRYAESPWCLNELVDMLKTKAPFIPVFCDVKPSDVRYPDKGVYKGAFADHERKGRYSKETLKNWKQALRSSAGFSGHEFNTSKDNVEELCAKISLIVQQKVGRKGFLRDEETANDAEDAAATSRSAQWKKSSLLPRDSYPVGIHSKVEEIEALLENPDYQVITVVGMGGLGKTFLLQHVYNALKSRYHHSVWLSISKYYSVKKLQHDIASRIGLESKIVEADVTEERAAELINERLQGKRCLIVLDDLWTLSTEDNLLDKLGLPIQKDCKVAVTTRNKEVAQNSKSHVYEMKNLTDEDSWELFCFYAFSDSKGKAPSNLEVVGREIVKQCGNLPLAIKTTAASLANTSSLRKWEFKRDQLKKAAIPFGERDTVMDILRLSYDSLPAHLKACFAYLSFFPEDEKIDPENLVYLWIAEGFIPAEAGNDQWDMAWHWVDRLAQLCLLQLWEEPDKDETQLTKYCTVHDLLHDLAINISRENKCAFSLEEAYTHKNGVSGWCRILLAKKDINDNALSRSRPAYLRTLSLAQNEKITSIPEDLFQTVRGLRVLDLSHTGICTLPESVGKMILLKVLNLRDTEIKEVPECVKYLKGLLFLALPFTDPYLRDPCLLPEWITELRCLKHLEYPNASCMPKGISKLISLRTIRTDVLLESIEEGLPYMIQLEELGLRVERETELKRIEEGILSNVVKMRCLGIDNMISDHAMINCVYKLPDKITEMKHLESLTLCSFALPSSICNLANLRELRLYSCQCDDYPELQKMPNLVNLVLDKNEGCRELPKAFAKSAVFPNLRFFTVDGFKKLEVFPELEDGAMPCLEILCVKACYRLKKVGGLERLKRLKEFNYSGGNKKFVETFKEGGEYCNKIKALNPQLTMVRIW